jgi:hypothetical protein
MFEAAMEQQNLFAEDWINCLRAHYVHVIRERDENNEQSLVSVLLETGFSEDDINAMRTEVMTSFGWEDEPAEPEMLIAEEASYEWVLQPEPSRSEVAIESVVEAFTETSEMLMNAIELEVEAEMDPVANSDEGEEPPDSFVQMSLF